MTMQEQQTAHASELKQLLAAAPKPEGATQPCSVCKGTGVSSFWGAAAWLALQANASFLLCGRCKGCGLEKAKS